MHPKSKLVALLFALLALAGILYLWPTSRNQVTAPESEEDTTMQEDQFTEVITEEVDYHNGVKGYLARPAAEGTYPALVLIHEWWGLNENIRDFAERFARQGYVALAVDLYDGEVAETREEAGRLAGAVRGNLEPAFANLRDAVAYLQTRTDVQSDALASVGWCFGGGWSYQMAVNDLGVDASIMYYGQFDPEDDFEHMRATILGHFGETDGSILVDDVNEFAAKLEAANSDHAVYVYPNAGHAFANEDNLDAYNEEAAALSWTRTLHFLREHVK